MYYIHVYVYSRKYYNNALHTYTKNFKCEMVTMSRILKGRTHNEFVSLTLSLPTTYKHIYIYITLREVHFVHTFWHRRLYQRHQDITEGG